MRVAILLAAGASRRMGRPKLELDLGGKTVLERSVQALLDASIDRVRVVVADETALPPMAGVDVVINRNPDRGLASSLGAGLRDLPEDTTMILVSLADKPLVRVDTIEKLIRTFEQSSVDVVYPVYRGEQGHPVLFDGRLADELAAVEGDRGAKTVMEAHRSDARAVSVDDAGVCFDIDTEVDYAAAKERLREDEAS